MTAYVYCLKSTVSNRTYVGKTIDLERRLKQHNGWLPGGAKYTKKGRPYRFFIIVSGFITEKSALKFEKRWHIIGSKKLMKSKYLPNRWDQLSEVLRRYSPEKVFHYSRSLVIYKYDNCKCSNFIQVHCTIQNWICNCQLYS